MLNKPSLQECIVRNNKRDIEELKLIRRWAGKVNITTLSSLAIWTAGIIKRL